MQPGDNALQNDAEEPLSGSPEQTAAVRQVRAHEAPLSVERVAGRLGVDAHHVAELLQMLELHAPGGGVDVADVEILQLLLEVVRQSDADEDKALRLARSLGHHAARLADWQVMGIHENLARRKPSAEAQRLTEVITRRELPRVERLLVAVWRRHVDAVLRWQAERVHEGDALVLTVGFADLVGYTERTATLDGASLATFVRSFQRLCVNAVARRGGRLVKSLGDEVLFATEDTVEGVATALDLRDVVAASGLLPDVRVGLASGPVVPILGDLHGATVNLAHRLTQVAPPGHVLVDEPTGAAALSAGIAVRSAPAATLQGIGVVPVWLCDRL